MPFNMGKRPPGRRLFNPDPRPDEPETNRQGKVVKPARKPTTKPTLHRNPHYRSVGGSWVVHTESVDAPKDSKSRHPKRYRYVIKQGSKIIKKGPWRKQHNEAFETGRTIVIHHNVKMK